MITGDSMTQGATGGHSWRYYLWRSLAEPQSYDFVGNLNGPAIFMAPWARKNDPSNYADPHFDYNHASIAGDTVCPDRRRLYGEKSIGELVQRIEATKPKPPSDLLNGPHKVCECGSPGCGCPIIPPRGKP